MEEFFAANMDAILWLAAAVLLLLLEMATVQMVSIWLSIGAFAATVAAMLGTGLTAQFAVFILVSALSLALTRKFVSGVIHAKKVHTNADSVIGMAGSVLEDIDNLAQTGRVRVNGLDWTARAQRDEIIKIGTTVIVNSIEGVKLMVVPKE